MNYHIHPSDPFWDDIEETAMQKLNTMKTDTLLIRINADLKKEFKRKCKDKSMSKVLNEYIKWYNNKPE